MNLLSGLVLMLWAVVAIAFVEMECRRRPKNWGLLVATLLAASTSLGCALWQLAVAIGGMR